LRVFRHFVGARSAARVCGEKVQRRDICRPAAGFAVLVMPFDDGRGRSGEPNASPPDARCGPSVGPRSLEVLLALALQASLAEPHRRIRIGLPLAALDGCAAVNGCAAPCLGETRTETVKRAQRLVFRPETPAWRVFSHRCGERSHKRGASQLWPTEKSQVICFQQVAISFFVSCGFGTGRASPSSCSASLRALDGTQRNTPVSQCRWGLPWEAGEGGAR